MIKFYCEFLNPISGMRTIEIEAGSYKEAVEKAKLKYRRGMINVWKDQQQTKQITDAENILFEMDANGIDEIVIREGLGLNTIYTRKEVEDSIKSSNAIRKLSALSAMKGELDI